MELPWEGNNKTTHEYKNPTKNMSWENDMDKTAKRMFKL